MSVLLSTNMHKILYLQICSLSFTFVFCNLIKNGVFDNVTVVVKGLEKTTREDVIFIDFDDNLNKHVDNKSEIVIIRNQFIPTLESDSVTDLTNVEILILAQDSIREIRRGAFKNLPSLRILNLSSNAIEEIHHGIFNDLLLQDLYLDNNKISKIGYKAFGNLQLRRIFLNNNKISRWSKDWFADSSILFMNMAHNLIEYLPPKSFNLMKKPVNGSMSLIFTGNQLKRINNNIFFGFDNFRNIFLDSNFIDRIDSGVFNGVKHIKTLNLNNNSLFEINSEVFGKVQVDILMLEDNKIRCLSTDIFKMEELDIDGNPITCFCVKTWLDWRDQHSNPSIYHITNLEQECI